MPPRANAAPKSRRDVRHGNSPMGCHHETIHLFGTTKFTSFASQEEAASTTFLLVGHTAKVVLHLSYSKIAFEKVRTECLWAAKKSILRWSCGILVTLTIRSVGIGGQPMSFRLSFGAVVGSFKRKQLQSRSVLLGSFSLPLWNLTKSFLPTDCFHSFVLAESASTKDLQSS